MERPSSPTRKRTTTGRFRAGGAPDIAARFWPNVDKVNGPIHPTLGQCWPWMGYRRPSGYGMVSYKGHPVRAHRVAFFLVRGKWPKPNALHRCDYPPCVRDEHLFEGTLQDNSRDMIAKGRMKEPPNGTVNREKTHCKRGHEFSPQNTYLKPRRKGGTSRCCITCRNAIRRNGRGKDWRKGARAA